MVYAQSNTEKSSFNLDISINDDFEFQFNSESLDSIGEGLKALAIAEGYKLDKDEFKIETIKDKHYLNGQELSPEFLDKVANFVEEKCKAFVNGNQHNWNIQID